MPDFFLVELNEFGVVANGALDNTFGIKNAAAISAVAAVHALENEKNGPEITHCVIEFRIVVPFLDVAFFSEQAEFREDREIRILFQRGSNCLEVVLGFRAAPDEIRVGEGARNGSPIGI